MDKKANNFRMNNHVLDLLKKIQFDKNIIIINPEREYKDFWKKIYSN